MSERALRFHRKWLGLAQPIEGLVFSLPVLLDAQITPDEQPGLSAAFEAQLSGDPPRIADLAAFFRDFLGYDAPGEIVPRDALPEALSFYAAEGGQEIRPSFALARQAAGPVDALSGSLPTPQEEAPPFWALAWDLCEHGEDIDLDKAEATTGPWRYPPTAKFERLLRQVGIPIGFLSNGRSLRLVYAPQAESTGHLTFRVEHLRGVEGRSLLTALRLLLHADRTHGAYEAHTLEGLLAESRRRQADITEELAGQVFEAVELLIAAFEEAARRDAGPDRLDWLRPALEAEDDHFYQGVLSVVLRLVFLLYAEDQSLLPVEHPTYARHLSLNGLYARLRQDAAAHPESMHHRFGAYGQLLSLFRAVFYGVRHGACANGGAGEKSQAPRLPSPAGGGGAGGEGGPLRREGAPPLILPPRRGRLFDPSAFPFLEGGLPGGQSPTEPEERAAAQPPSIDDGSIHQVLQRLLVFKGQRLSYRALDVEQIGSVYESLMGYQVLRLESPAVRLGKRGVWVQLHELRGRSAADRRRFLKEACGLGPARIQEIEKAVEAGADDQALLDALGAAGRRGEAQRAPAGKLVLQPGEERRKSGSHYTPRSLTEGIVRRTLEPLLAKLGPAPTAEQILQLKICDPAMGSGAFLVAACRELAAALVAAWTRSGELPRILEAHGDAHLHGRRLVAQQCLYGVDRNAMAVELAKLSLWLVTLSRELPFTFVDHALRHGDSLVGLDFRQIESFHWKPSQQVETCHGILKEALEEAVALRQQILALATREDPVAQAEKRRLFAAALDATAKVRFLADLCVGAFFAEAKPAAREKERNRRLDLVEIWIRQGKVAEDENRSARDREEARRAAREAYEALEPLAAEARERLVPFHWWIEFPEVFYEQRPDPLQGGKVTGEALMEAVVGNPPFGGKNTIIAGNPEHYLPWLQAVHPGAHGNSDLSAHFFRRASRLLAPTGRWG